MRRSPVKLLSGIVLVLVLPQAAADSLEVIELRHRNAEDLIPLLSPLLEGQGVVTGRGHQLIVRVGHEQLEQLQAVLLELDVPQTQLVISVRRQNQGEATWSSAELSGAIDLGREGRLSIDHGFPGEGARIGIAGGNTRRDEHLMQQIQVVDGGEAYIEVGEVVPLQERYIVRDGRRVREYTSTDYQPLTTGFYVSPRLQGERVTLEISPHQRRATGTGRIITQSLATTVSGRLGEWLPVAVSDTQDTARDHALPRRDRETVRDERRILLKVETVP
jgi:hypothetical protein